MSQYPQYAGRVPVEVLETLKAIATVTGQPQWRVLTDAVNIYVDRLPVDERSLLTELLGRSEPLFAQPSRTPKRDSDQAARITILNVDDNEAMRFARTRLLESEGFTVVEAPTGAAALSLLEAHSPRIVLLDVNLPDMSGLEVCRRIRADERFAEVKIVQTSATYSSTHDQLHGLVEGGADIYLAEPVQRGALLSILRRLAAD